MQCKLQQQQQQQQLKRTSAELRQVLKLLAFHGILIKNLTNSKWNKNKKNKKN